MKLLILLLISFEFAFVSCKKEKSLDIQHIVFQGKYIEEDSCMSRSYGSAIQIIDPLLNNIDLDTSKCEWSHEDRPNHIDTIYHNMIIAGNIPNDYKIYGKSFYFTVSKIDSNINQVALCRTISYAFIIKTISADRNTLADGK